MPGKGRKAAPAVFRPFVSFFQFTVKRAASVTALPF